MRISALGYRLLMAAGLRRRSHRRLVAVVALGLVGAALGARAEVLPVAGNAAPLKLSLRQALAIECAQVLRRIDRFE